jgi:soluble lytic murein transglycosylase-like protein
MPPDIDELSVHDVPYWDTFVTVGELFEIAPELLAAQCWVESQFDPKAVGLSGERGIAQFMPDTWDEWSGGDPFDPIVGIRAQAGYLTFLHSYLSEYNRPGVRWALAAYNCGPGRARDAESYHGVPRTTRSYVQRVISVYLQYTVFERREHYAPRK